MATVAETFQGVAAFITANDATVGDLGYNTTTKIDLVVVDGYTTPALTSSIDVPLPTGCVAFDNVFATFADDGGLYVEVKASSASTSAAAAAAPDQMKGQLHKYVVTDDGQYTLAWHGTETGFMGSPYAASPEFPGGLVVTRDGSWGVWGMPFDAGTGVFAWPATVGYFDSFIGQTYQAFTSSHVWYEASGFANCLHRVALPISSSGDAYHEAVAFDGTVVRGAYWPAPKISDYVPGSASEYSFQGMAAMKSYRDPFLDVFASWYNAYQDAYYFQSAPVDLDTYLPLNWSPLVGSGQQTFGAALDVFPLGGVSGSPVSNELLMLKRGPDQYFVPFNSTAVVRPTITTVSFNNGLTAGFDVDSGNDPHYLHHASLGWIDSTGASTAIGSVALSQEPRVGTWVFRPVLPTDRLTGYMDSSRRLFTAV